MGMIINKLAYEKEKLIRRFNRFVYYLYRKPTVIGMDETLDALLNRKASIARFGDGEFDLIFGRFQSFQLFNQKLKIRLKEVLKANGVSETFLVGIPDCYGDLSHFIPEAQHHWRIRLEKERFKWYKILNRKKPYYQSQISRFYHDWADKSKSPVWAMKLKKLWEGRNVLIVEGAQSRMGVGNDLFDGCKSIRRILCPARNAFDKYDVILNRMTELAVEDDLILMALGPTASILAYDLHSKGYQAVDIGHIDLEYEWMKRGAKDKERIPGRFMNELDGGDFVDDTSLDPSYFDQIISIID